MGFCSNFGGKRMAQNWMVFEEFLWDSFRNGQNMRELRLSQDELSYLKARYPLASYSRDSQEEDGKNWYVITLKKREPFYAPVA